MNFASYNNQAILFHSLHLESTLNTFCLIMKDIQSLPADLERFRSELPLCNDYQKLNERYKDNLKGAKTVIPR